MSKKFDFIMLSFVSFIRTIVKTSDKEIFVNVKKMRKNKFVGEFKF